MAKLSAQFNGKHFIHYTTAAKNPTSLLGDKWFMGILSPLSMNQARMPNKSLGVAGFLSWVQMGQGRILTASPGGGKNSTRLLRMGPHVGPGRANVGSLGSPLAPQSPSKGDSKIHNCFDSCLVPCWHPTLLHATQQNNDPNLN